MANCNVSLSSLPKEILLEIFKQTPHSSYPSLARVRQSFYALVIPLLYRAVYYTRLEYTYDRENYDFRHSRSEIREHMISAFAHSVQSNPSLADLVKQASFEWRDDTNVIDNGIIPAAIPHFFNLEQLHLSSLRNIFTSPINTALITSLKIDSSSLSTIYIEGVSQEELFLIFGFPRLERLSIHWQSTKTFLVHTPDSVKRAHTSNVTSLSIYAAMPEERDLAEILSWPKKLKSLKVLMRCNGVTQSWNNEDWKDVHTTDVVKALQTQTLHLEELFLAGQDITYESVDLRQFTSLRRLDLCQGDTMFYHQPAGPGSVMQLSPHLEVLRIDFCYRRAWALLLKRSGKPIEEDPICVWLSDVALNAFKYPKLKRLVLDDAAYQNVNLGSRHLEAIAKALLGGFEKAGIELILNKTPKRF